MAGGAGEYICPCGHGLLQAVAMYDAGFVVFCRTVILFHCERGRIGGRIWWASRFWKVLEGLVLILSPFGATADVGFFGGFGDG